MLVINISDRQKTVPVPLFQKEPPLRGRKLLRTRANNHISVFIDMASTLCQISKAPHGVLEVARRPQADGAEGQAWGAIVSDVPLTGPPRTLTGVWPWLEAWQLRLRCPVVFKE